MFSRAFLSSITEGRKNGLAFVPVGKLIGIVAAPRLAGLSCGNQQYGHVPIAGVGHEAHCRAMSLRRRSDAVDGSRLRFVRNAEELFQQSFAAERMNYVKRVEAFPGPVLDPLAPALLSESRHRLVGRGGQQLVIALECGRQPLRRPNRNYLLQESGRPPLVDAGFFSQERLKKNLYRRPPRRMEKRDLRRIGLRDAIPIL